LLIKIITWIVDLIAPNEERLARLLKLDNNELRSILPKAQDIEDPLTLPIFNYRNKDVKVLVWALKYKAHPQILNRLAGILYEEIIAVAEERLEFEGKTNISLVPIPMSKQRLREKGFNQTELLCEEINKISRGHITVLNILEKIQNTIHQTSLHRKERLQNMKNAMKLKAGAQIPPDSLIIIIDDVYTTGATILEARRALSTKPGSPSTLLAITLAH
jgi:ComF family protein